jgi:NAD(P)-dependent dehydrogenase (short-subunit alcohol dehydrogenase family)
MKKVILISGANRGIGYAIAKHLQSTGQYDLSLGIRNTKPEELLDCFTCFFDAKDPSSAKSWVDQTVDKFGRIDGLIHCAGILKPFGIDDDEAILDEMFEVNVKGTLRVCREALPYLEKSGQGRIINLVSMSGKRVKGKNIGYGISKYAQLALTHGLKNIGWESGVRVTAICPSWVASDMAEKHSSMELEEMSQPEDIANIVETVLNQPNTIAFGDILINCNLES